VIQELRHVETDTETKDREIVELKDHIFSRDCRIVELNTHILTQDGTIDDLRTQNLARNAEIATVNLQNKELVSVKLSLERRYWNEQMYVLNLQVDQEVCETRILELEKGIGEQKKKVTRLVQELAKERGKGRESKRSKEQLDRVKGQLAERMKMIGGGT